MLGGNTGGRLLFFSDRDSVFFREPVILAEFRAVWPRSYPVQTRVFSEIFSGISGSRARRVEIWDSGNTEPDPTTHQKRRQGCRIAEGRRVRGRQGRTFRVAYSIFLDCRL